MIVDILYIDIPFEWADQGTELQLYPREGQGGHFGISNQITCMTEIRSGMMNILSLLLTDVSETNYMFDLQSYNWGFDS